MHFKRVVLIMPLSASLRHLGIFDVLHTDGAHAFFPPAGFNNLADFQLLFQHANESSARMRTQGIDLGVDEDNLQERLSLKVPQPRLKMDIIKLFYNDSTFN